MKTNVRKQGIKAMWNKVKINRKYWEVGKIIATTILLLLALLLPVSERAKIVLYSVGLALIAVDPFIKSLEIFKTRRLDENLLMLLAATGAFILQEYAEGILVLLLSAIGGYFERYAVNKSRGFISQILEMRTPYANILRDGSFVKSDPDEIVKGDILLIKAGERIPVDGIVKTGHSTLDTSALTGESLPKEIAPDEDIISGCINLGGNLTMEAVCTYENSTVAKILELVENSLNKKAKTENFIGKFARYYTPIVVLAALIIGIVPSIVTGDWSRWMYSALSFLVISCPCALVISVPLSFFRGIGLASKRGILIKGSAYMEKLARLKTVAVDKTGTLTKGNFVAQHIFEKEPNGNLYRVALLLEQESNHPIARAVARCAEKVLSNANHAWDGKTAVNLKEAVNVKERAGMGVEATFDGRKALCGNAKLLREEHIAFSEFTGTGSAVYVSFDGHFLGYFVVKDEIKEDSYHLQEALHEVGVSRLVMLSGDDREVCAETAKQLNIEEFYGNLLPVDKLERLRALKTGLKRGYLAFAGDGINDAPSLAESDVGIAMGGLGSDIAIETADAVIMEDKPIKIAEAVKISRRTVKIATQNIVFALGVKLAVMVLSLLGITPLWIAIFADVGVSILAILNAIRPYKPNGLQEKQGK